MKLACISVLKKSTVKTFTVTTLSLAISLSFPLKALAQDSVQHAYNEQGGSQWGLGVAVLSKQIAYTDMDRDTMALPFVTYENEYIRWFGPEIGIKLSTFELSNSQQISFNISAGYDFSGYDKDDIKDTLILNGMDERDGSFEAGAEIEWKTPWVDVNAKWMADVSGDRKGTRFGLDFEKSWGFGENVILSAHMGATWLDDKFVDYQYGVRPEEALTNRAAYVGESTVNIEYGVRGAYLIDMNHSILVDVGITSLGNEIKDSPLVDTSTENNITLFYMYNF